MHFYQTYQEGQYHFCLPCSCLRTLLTTSSCLCPISSLCGVMLGLVGMYEARSIQSNLSELLARSSKEYFFPFNFSPFLEFPSLLLSWEIAMVQNLLLRAAMMGASWGSGETPLRFLPREDSLALPLNSPSLRKESSREARLLVGMSFQWMQMWEQSMSPLMGGSLSWVRPCGKTLYSWGFFLGQALNYGIFFIRSSSSMLSSVFLAYSSMGSPFLSRRSWSAWEYLLNWGKEGGGQAGERGMSSGGSVVQGEKWLALRMDFNYFICIIILRACTKKHFKQHTLLAGQIEPLLMQVQDGISLLTGRHPNRLQFIPFFEVI